MACDARLLYDAHAAFSLIAQTNGTLLAASLAAGGLRRIRALFRRLTIPTFHDATSKHGSISTTQGEAVNGGVARFLHWLMVVLIAAQFLTGWTGPGVHRCTQPIGLIAWQLGVRAALAAAMAVRVDWRVSSSHRPTRCRRC